MTKQTKTMLLMAGLLLILLVAFASILIYTSQQDGSSDDDKEDSGIVISRLAQEDIVGFSFQLNAEEFDNDVLTFKKMGDTWYYEGDDQFPVIQKVAETKTTVLSQLTALRIIEHQTSDLSKYGLDTPVLTVSVTDGKNILTYLIGDYNANSETYYMKIKDQNEIYTVDGTLWVAFSLELQDFADIQAFPEIQVDHMMKVTIDNPAGKSEFSFTREDTETDNTTGVTTILGTWYVKDGAGNMVKANQSKTELLMSILANMEYASLVDYDCSEEEIISYGLTEPAMTITVDYTVDEPILETVQKVELADGINTYEYETESKEYQMVLRVGDSSEAVNYEDEYFLWVNDNKSIVTLDADTAGMLAGVVGADYVQN